MEPLGPEIKKYFVRSIAKGNLKRKRISISIIVSPKLEVGKKYSGESSSNSMVGILKIKQI